MEGEGWRGGQLTAQNSHKQSLLSGLVRHFHRIRKSFERTNFEFCDFLCEGECHLGTYHRDACLVIFDC